MKQFYETYSDSVIVSSLMTQLQIVENRINSASQTESKNVNKYKKVSTALKQIQHANNQVYEFVSTLLSQIQWSSHWPISFTN